MWQKTFALGSFAQKLPLTTTGFAFFTRFFFRRFFVKITQFHFAKHTLALHFLFQGAQRLIDIIVSDMDQQVNTSSQGYSLNEGRNPDSNLN